MPRRGFTKLYSALLNIHLKSIKFNKHLNSKDMTKSLDFAMQAIQASGCEISVDPSGNVSFANLHGVQNDRTHELLIKFAFMAVAYK